MKEKRKFQQLTSENICQIYNLLHSEGIVAFPLTDEAGHKIESLVANINGSAYGIENYPTAEVKAVAYLYFLIKDHPFTDGNKRTAVLCFLVLCDLNELKSITRGFGLDALAVLLEGIKVSDHQKLIGDVSNTLFYWEEGFQDK
jgi:prophage maintenance system killer protein